MKKQDKVDIDTYLHKTSVSGLFIIERPIFPDERGSFHEVFRMSDLEREGVEFKPVQWSHSVSKPGVVRGIHTEPWQKMIYPVTGKVFAAYVDVRQNSKTFGHVEEIIMDNTKLNSSFKAVFIPPGVGNSLCVMGDSDVHYVYLVDEYWDNSKAQGIAWNDPDLAIDWPVKHPILSDRDRNNPGLRDLFPEKFK